MTSNTSMNNRELRLYHPISIPLTHKLAATSLNSLVEESHSQMNVPVSHQNGVAPVSGHLATVANHHSNAAAPGSEGNVGGEMGVASKVSITVTGDGDDDILQPSEEEVARRTRIRAHSLPPQLVYSPSLSPAPSIENDLGDEDSTSLDRSPSHLRRSSEFKTPEPPEISVSSVVHVCMQ